MCHGACNELCYVLSVSPLILLLVRYHLSSSTEKTRHLVERLTDVASVAGLTVSIVIIVVKCHTSITAWSTIQRRSGLSAVSWVTVVNNDQSQHR